MIAYASRTGTRANLERLRANGWRLLVSAAGELRSEGFRYALDNGAWSARETGIFDEPAFHRALEQVGAGADFVVAPDIVAGGLASLRLSEAWLPRLESLPLVLVPVQDGMQPGDVEPLLSDRVGLFLGGSTAWKLRTMPLWGAVAARRGVYYHVGRVNTPRRIHLCADAGAHSFDGSGAAIWGVTIEPLTRARRDAEERVARQSEMPWRRPRCAA